MNLELFLYTKKECRLCDELLGELETAVKGKNVAIHIIDITGDPELEHRYGARVPVLVSGTREICETKLDMSRLQALLAESKQ